MLPWFLLPLHFAQGPTASSPSILQLSGRDISADLRACVGESQRHHSPTPTSSHSSSRSRLILAGHRPAGTVHLSQSSLAQSLAWAFQLKGAWRALEFCHPYLHRSGLVLLPQVWCKYVSLEMYKAMTCCSLVPLCKWAFTQTHG